MRLEDLRPSKGAVKNKKRIGRGPGSGSGKTAGRGHKGQGSRSGSSIHPGFEGGQMPLQRRIPKRGFTNIFRTEYACVNIGRIASVFAGGSVVTPADLRQKGLIKGAKAAKIKILGDGTIEVALSVKAHAFTEGAQTKISGAGGSWEVLAG